MRQEKIKLYAIPAVMSVVLLSALFLPTTHCRAVAAVFLAVAAGVSSVLIKKRSILSINHRQVTGLLAVIAVVYTVMIYMLGIWLGFHRSATPLSAPAFWKNILPVIVIIVSTELIRKVLLAQSKTVVTVMAYLIGVLADLTLGHSLSGVTHVMQFMDIVGLTLFPAITSNLLCHYLVRRYGATSSTVYRLLLVIPTMLLPVTPAISDAIHSFLLVILPLVVHAFVNLLYEKRARYALQRAARWSYVGLSVTLACMIALIMLISGQFRYRLLVIATPSMTGSLNTGDAVIWERYDGHLIQEGDVVVFSKDNNTLIVHRVVDIERLDGKVYYTTKGDANDSEDPGYITEADFKGVVLFKVSHIGHPSLWLRKLFS